MADQCLRSQLGVLIISGEALFHSTGDISPWKQHPAAAPQTLQTDIRTDTHHNPIRAATWVWLAKADHIVQLDIWEHHDSLWYGLESSTKIAAAVHRCNLLLPRPKNDKTLLTHGLSTREQDYNTRLDGIIRPSCWVYRLLL